MCVILRVARREWEMDRKSWRTRPEAEGREGKLQWLIWTVKLIGYINHVEEKPLATPTGDCLDWVS